ncbi:hypothetical protein HHK36_001914 [Tetracentron sinense]|uniref:Alpha 1,4-glycosyltransferase domain-containing protein n=1 Tax=Tetracentron sinense TaxID=13715 RepID=A0A834ZYX0_TETSI|nr:hypothetical protein HHK36_001914 [Tetracentron sinense]
MDENRSNNNKNNPSLFLRYLQKMKRYVLSLFFCFPTSLLALLLLLLLTYNGASIFCIHVPFPAKTAPDSDSFSPGNSVGETTRQWSSSSSSLSSSVLYAVKEQIPPSKLKTQLPLLQKSESSALKLQSFSTHTSRRLRKNKPLFKILQSNSPSRRFSERVKEFFRGSSLNSSNSPCKIRFFMTWISSLESFGYRELFAVESLFKSHPDACLLIISNSMDSRRGAQLLRPFLDHGFWVTVISPDFHYIFKNTFAEAWFDRLRKGNVDPGEVSLGQNLSNLLRLAILYKFGGIYLDTDVIVLKSFSKLRNVIGAQTVDLETGNWSRLNNAVLIFDKKHPLLLKFIEEFALTFNGNKWGHNGPYLVSRVVSRVSGRPDFNFTVLPPPAFYPVDWSRIQSLFRGPREGAHSRWLLGKLRHIRRQSFAIHLWNRQSRELKVEEGSIIAHIMSDCCIFCNSWVSSM